jgi:chromate reductase, NAD(P)H dehydrogenase (quinone)
LNFLDSEEVMTRNVALLVGSLRKESWTKKIANLVVEVAPSSLHFERIEIGELPLYNQDLETDKPPRAWVDFRDRVRRLDAVLFATPEYNRSVPGVLKNAIDVGSRPYGRSVFANKPAAIISVSPGALGAFGANHHLRQSLVFLDMPCMQQPEIYIANVAKLFDSSGKAADGTTDLLKKFGEEFAGWIERLTHEHAAESAA